MRNDVLLDELFRLPTEFQQGDSDQQHVELLVELNKGELSEFPWVGFGIERWSKKVSDTKKFIRELRVEMENDGYSGAEIIVNDDLSNFKIEI